MEQSSLHQLSTFALCSTINRQRELNQSRKSHVSGITQDNRLESALKYYEGFFDLLLFDLSCFLQIKPNQMPFNPWQIYQLIVGLESDFATKPLVALVSTADYLTAF